MKSLVLVAPPAAALNDTFALERMYQRWLENLQATGQVIAKLGGEVTLPTPAPPLSVRELNELDRRTQKSMGQPLPGQLRWLLSKSRALTFAWRTPEIDKPRGDLGEIGNYGGVRDFVWNHEMLDIDGQALQSWLDIHPEDDEDADKRQAFWSQHLGWLELPNGDWLTLNLRETDPLRQSVHYFSHEDNDDGYQLAVNLFDFIGSWSALGCAGSEWFSWSSVLKKTGENVFELDWQGPLAQQWHAWLSGDRPQGINVPPKPIAAHTQADLDLLRAARDGDLTGVGAALAAGAEINCCDIHEIEADWTKQMFHAVTYAAVNNDLPMLEYLVENKASLDTEPLLLDETLWRLTPPTIFWLVNKGTRIEPWDGGDQRHVLHHLYQCESLDVDQWLELLDILLSKGCNPDTPWQVGTPEGKTTLLHRAGPKTQARLLNAGCNPNARTIQGETAMHLVSKPAQVV